MISELERDRQREFIQGREIESVDGNIEQREIERGRYIKREEEIQKLQDKKEIRSREREGERKILGRGWIKV